ncbi:hypothetical protein [Gemmata sp.]|uniref:hypothetical protein n=1 Tax=Gemmata sp. TaxID=1914242 RepID=UPI003F708F76
MARCPSNARLSTFIRAEVDPPVPVYVQKLIDDINPGASWTPPANRGSDPATLPPYLKAQLDAASPNGTWPPLPSEVQNLLDAASPTGHYEPRPRAAATTSRHHDAGQDEGAVIERTVSYLATLPEAVSGSRGSTAAMKAARVVCWGFDLGEDVGYEILAAHYNPRCQPPWSESELRKKCRDAMDPKGAPWPRGHLRDADRDGYTPGKSSTRTGPHPADLIIPGLLGYDPVTPPVPPEPAPLTPEPTPPQQTRNSGHTHRARVRLTEVEYLANDAAAAALRHLPDVFHRGGQLVRTIDAEAGEENHIWRDTSTRIVPVSQATLRDRLTRVVNFVKETGSDAARQDVPATPPDPLVKAVLDRGRWPGLRPLHAIVDHPVVRPDGSVLANPGYDPATALYLVAGSALLNAIEIPAEPGHTEASQAARDLLHVVADFPFSRDAYRAAWLAALLTPFARFAFRGPAPLFLFDANSPGVGKSLVANTIALIITGKNFATSDYVHDPNEMRKRITAIADEGDRMVLFDNVEGRFGNRPLCIALTSDTWKDRELGKNSHVVAPLVATWYATGNNPQVVGDIARRIVHTRMVSGEDQPDERQGFVHADLRSWVQESRPRLVAAALTILTAYIRNGCPASNLKPWGDYIGWSRIIRGALVWVGLPDPIETKGELRESANPTLGALQSVLAGWDRIDPNHDGLTANQVVKKLFSPSALEDTTLDDLRDAVDALTGEETHAKKAGGLGYKFRMYKNRRLGGMFIETSGKQHHGLVKWVARNDYAASTVLPD